MVSRLRLSLKLKTTDYCALRHSFNRDLDCRKIVRVPASLSLPSLTDHPPQTKAQERKGGGNASSKKNILWHTNNGCHLTKHARTGTLKQVGSAYTQTRQQWNLQNHRDQLESTKFSPSCVRVKKSSLGQKLCTSYLNTYHYTTGSRRTRGSRVEKKEGKPNQY